MEELEELKQQEIYQRIENWVHETFFKGDDVNEDELCEGISWLYSSSMENMPKILILDSPLECQLALHKITEADSAKSLANSIEFDAWRKVQDRMYELAWTDIWCESLPVFKTAESIFRFRDIGTIIIHHIENAVKKTERRFHKFSEDNLFNRYAKLAFFDFISGTLHEGSRGTQYTGSNIGYLKAGYVSNYTRFLKAGCFLSLFFKGFAFISRRPRDIRFNSSGQLHCDGNAAIEWRDGWKQYYLNGIQVPEEIAVPPPENVNPQLILKERNVEVRREIVRKIGIERVMQKLGGRVIDSWNGYELITLQIPDMQTRPIYLKMRNPSIGTYHVEGVPPRITTCKEALSWRVGGLKWNPEQLT